MAFVAENEDNFPAGIYQLETTDDVLGGAAGASNKPGRDAADRTAWLRKRLLQAIRASEIKPVLADYAISAADVGKVLSVIDPLGIDFQLPALAGFPKNQPFTIAINNDGSANNAMLKANGAEIVEDFLNSGDGLVNYPLAPGTRIVLVATPTSWVVVLKTVPAIEVSGYLPGDIAFTAKGVSARPGFLLCDGSAVNRTTYAALFAAIGVTWGAGNGVTTFNLPNHKDVFLRAFNGGGSGKDPGRVFGSYQDDAIKTHTINIPGGQLSTTDGGGTDDRLAAGGDNVVAGGGINLTYNGATETRPKNVGVNTFIKY